MFVIVVATRRINRKKTSPQITSGGYYDGGLINDESLNEPYTIKDSPKLFLVVTLMGYCPSSLVATRAYNFYILYFVMCGHCKAVIE